MKIKHIDPKDVTEAVGQFLAGFNEIEAQTYLLLRMLPSDELTEYAKKIDRFEGRARFIQALLKSSDWDNRKDIHTLLDRALKLSTYRNKLSHNPIRITLYADHEDCESGIAKPSLINAKSGMPINQGFNGLKDKLEETIEISTALSEFTFAFDFANTH